MFLVSSLLSAQQAGNAPVAVSPVTLAPITIRVTDPSGAPVPHAQVRVMPAPDTPGKMETDDKGQLAFDLKPGGHAVFVRAQGFKPMVMHINVAQKDARSDTAAQTVPIVLQVGSGSGVIPEYLNDLVLSADPYHDPLGFSFADLKAMPHITVTFHNPHTNADETYSGVRLADLLGKLGAPLGSDLRGDALSYCVVASGSDGYHVVLALAEVDPSFHSGEVLVADTMNGKPLDAHSGPLKLVVTEDKRPARSVRNLTTIELRLLH